MAKYLNGTTDRAALVAELKRLRDAIAVHRRDHTGDTYSARDRKLYTAVGINVSPPVKLRPTPSSS